MTKPIVFLLSNRALKKHIDISYKESYIYLAAMAQKHGIDVRFVLGVEHYKDGLFTSYWKFHGDELVQIHEAFKAHVVYVRDRIKHIAFEKKVNDSLIEEICRDKLKTYQTYPTLVKKTVLVSPVDISSFGQLQTELVALKPRYGSNGRSVQVLPKGDITPEILRSDEFVAQELIDSSGGIEGILSQRHELRVYVFNGEIRAGYIRVPAPHSYIANISRGAKEKQIQLSDIPQSAIDLAGQVDSKFTHTPRLYTIDIMYEHGKPWVVELNDNPGMPDITIQPFTDDYLTTLLDFLQTS